MKTQVKRKENVSTYQCGTCQKKAATLYANTKNRKWECEKCCFSQTVDKVVHKRNK